MKLRLIALFSFVFAFGGLLCSRVPSDDWSLACSGQPWTPSICAKAGGLVGGGVGASVALCTIMSDGFESNSELNSESNNSASTAEKIRADVAGLVAVCGGGFLGGLIAMTFTSTFNCTCPTPKLSDIRAASIGAGSGAVSGGLTFGVFVAVGFGGIYLVNYGKRVYNKFYSNQEPQ